MGWFDDDFLGHEGYIAAIVAADHGLFRELGTGDNERRVYVPRFAVACTCGWRSPQCVAPLGTTWSPYIILLPDRDEERYETAARLLWHAHLSECRGVKSDPASIFDLVEALIPPGFRQGAGL